MADDDVSELEAEELDDGIQTREIGLALADGARGAEVRWHLEEGGPPLLGITVYEEPIDIVVTRGESGVLVQHLAVGRGADE